MYIHDIYSDIYIFKEYYMYLPCIYNVYTCADANLNWICIVYYAYILPCGWCWGGGQGPIPPAPPAITSPGRVLTFILLHSCSHLGFLLLVAWMRRARMEQKIAGKCSAWQARHTGLSSSTSLIPVSEGVPMTRTTKPTARRSGCWNKE